MNPKTTGLLVVVALAIGLVAYLNPFAGDEAEKERPLWFYQISEEDMIGIDVSHLGSQVSFVRNEFDTWEFSDPQDVPPMHFRWGGVPLLLSGPQTRRDLSVVQATVDDPAQYGLADPVVVVDLALTEGREIQFALGDKTTDGAHHYGQVSGFPQLFLVAATWGDILGRLATEPPLPAWFIKRDPASISEMNLYGGNPDSKQTQVVQFKNEEGLWTARDYYVHNKGTPVDPERWAALLPLLTGPPNLGVEVPLVEDLDYSPWGITEDSLAIEIRFRGETQKGTVFFDGVLFRIGSKTPDGLRYYARSETDEFRQPVLLLDPEWTETLLGLFDDIPYGEDPGPPTADQPGLPDSLADPVIPRDE